MLFTGFTHDFIIFDHILVIPCFTIWNQVENCCYIFIMNFCCINKQNLTDVFFLRLNELCNSRSLREDGSPLQTLLQSDHQKHLLAPKNRNISTAGSEDPHKSTTLDPQSVTQTQSPHTQIVNSPRPQSTYQTAKSPPPHTSHQTTKSPCPQSPHQTASSPGFQSLYQITQSPCPLSPHPAAQSRHHHGSHLMMPLTTDSTNAPVAPLLPSETALQTSQCLSQSPPAPLGRLTHIPSQSLPSSSPQPAKAPSSPPSSSTHYGTSLLTSVTLTSNVCSYLCSSSTSVLCSLDSIDPTFSPPLTKSQLTTPPPAQSPPPLEVTPPPVHLLGSDDEEQEDPTDYCQGETIQL